LEKSCRGCGMSKAIKAMEKMLFKILTYGKSKKRSKKKGKGVK
jgi:hypothetical protein